MIKTSLVNLVILVMVFFSCSKPDPTKSNSPTTSKVLYTMPEESEPHEGTWLQWPHEYQYGVAFRDRLDATWVKITEALVNSEKVHIIAYDDKEKNRIIGILNTAGIPLTNVDFKIYPTDDFWIRDNGPIYVRDSLGKLLIEDWGFNAWGGKFKFENCNKIPSRIATDQSSTLIDLNTNMINEGGSVEIDGHGALMATKSSILNANRNPGMTQEKAEEIFTKYLGITKFIWLEGAAGLEITDMHIDGFARFASPTTIITMSDTDLLEWQVPQHDIGALYAATNKSNTPYTFVKLPLSKNNVVTAYGKNLGYKGSYVNYYIANNRVLVPNYNDPNDAVANGIIQGLYPGRTVVGIDCRNLYALGGMIHCMTQQQPK
jgi:agmatine deiminase